MSFHRVWLFHVALIVFLGLTVYSNTLGVPFQFDDHIYIEENPVIKDSRYLLHPSEADTLIQDVSVKSTVLTRQVGFISLFLNYRAHGLEPAGYHAVNIAVHVANALLVYLLVLLTFRAPALAGSALGGRGVALLSALLFVSHPVQTQAVTYIAQRFASLAALFCLLCVVSYALSRLSEGKAARYAFYALSLASAVLAMKTKENSFTLPLTVVFYELMFFEGAVRKRLLRLFPLLLTMLIIPLSLIDFGRPLGEALAGVTNSQIEISRYDYFITQPRVLVTYLRLLALPVNQNADYDYPVYGSFLDAEVLLSLVLLAGVILFGAYLYRRREPSGRLAAFGVFWFFIMLSVESSIIPLNDLIFEHRLYLPSVGIFTAVGVGAVYALGRFEGKKARIAGVCVIVILALAFSSGTFARNAVWQSAISLWEDTVMKSPMKARPHHGLGSAYTYSGNFDKAIVHYRTALILDPKYAKSYNNLCDVYLNKGLDDEAIATCKMAIKIDPGLVKAHINLGIAYSRMGLLNRGIQHLRTAVAIDPRNSKAYNNLGNAYMRDGSIDRAIENFKTAINIAPRNSTAYNNLGVAYLRKGLPDIAIEHFTTAINISPGYSRAYYNLGLAYAGKGFGDKAIEYYRRAISINPKYAEAYASLGDAYVEKGLIENAIESYKYSLSLEPNDPIVHKRLGGAYLKKGMKAEARRHFSIADSLSPGEGGSGAGGQ